MSIFKQSQVFWFININEFVAIQLFYLLFTYLLATKVQ